MMMVSQSGESEVWVSWHEAGNGGSGNLPGGRLQTEGRKVAPFMIDISP